MARVSHPSSAQVEALLALLERRPNLAKGFLKTKAAKEKAHREWAQVALQLNSMGGGAVKTTQKWIKYWNDKNNAVKKKAAARAASRTGGGAIQCDEIVELSHIEERILTLMGGQSFATGDSHLRINPFVDVSEPVEQDSPSIINVLETTHEQISTIHTSDDIATYCPSEYQISPVIIDEAQEQQATQGLTERNEFSIVSPYANPVAGPSRENPNPPLRDNVPPVSVPLPPSPPRHSPLEVEQPQHSTVSTPRRRRRRLFQRNGRPSPPSQRRSLFLTMVEKFIEYARRRDERIAERDRQIVASMQSIENILKVFVVINNVIE